MGDVFALIAGVAATAKQAAAAGEKLKHAELKNLLADLNMQLADVKIELASVMQENSDLKTKIRELEAAEGDPCPHCRNRGWHVEKSERDRMSGEVGGIRRTYKCSLCGFSESRLEFPK